MRSILIMLALVTTAWGAAADPKAAVLPDDATKALADYKTATDAACAACKAASTKAGGNAIVALNRARDSQMRKGNLTAATAIQANIDRLTAKKTGGKCCCCCDDDAAAPIPDPTAGMLLFGHTSSIGTWSIRKNEDFLIINADNTAVWQTPTKSLTGRWEFEKTIGQGLVHVYWSDLTNSWVSGGPKYAAITDLGIRVK